jgi:hypothetical protein
MAGKQISRSDGGIDSRVSPDPVRYFDSPSPTTTNSDDGNYDTGSALMCSEDEDEDLMVIAEMNRERIRRYWRAFVEDACKNMSGLMLRLPSGSETWIKDRERMENSGLLLDMFSDLVIEAVCK